MTPEELARVAGLKSEALGKKLAEMTEHRKKIQEAYDKGLYGKPGTACTASEGKKIFDDAVVWMAVQDRFGFQILSLCHKVPVPNMGTMGVSVRGVELMLSYDPVFVGSLPKTELNYIITHEVYHIALHHCTCRSPRDRRMHKLANTAMDLAINSIIPTGSGSDRVFPRFKADVVVDGKTLVKKGDRCGQHPDLYKDKEDKQWPTGLSYEEYFAMLMDREREKPEPPPPTVSVGDIVRDKVSGELGLVDSIADDGSVQITTVSREDAKKYLKARGGM